MPFGSDDSEKKGAPRTWGAATRMLTGKGAANVTDADLFGDDPLAARGKSAPLDYLGHFTNEDVTDEGHNTGMPRGVRKFHEGAAAKLGYRVIPGNASTGYIDRKTRAMVDAIDSKLGGTVAHGPIAAPAGHELRHRDRVAKARAGSGVGPITRADRKRR